MTQKSLAALAVLSLSVLFTSSTPAPAPTRAAVFDLEALVAGEAQAATGREVSELWGRAVELRDAERLGADGELDRVLDRHLARAETLSPQAILLLASCRLQGEDPDAVSLLEALSPVMQAGDETLGRGAAKLLGNREFKSLARGRRNDLVDEMLVHAEDAGRSPEYRLEFAKGVYRIGAGSARRKANTVMQSFLDSADADLRAQGALAIAEATEREIDGQLREVLEQLAQVPDERGALAAAYLKLEDERAYAERKLRDVRKGFEEEQLPPGLEEFLAVLNLIEERHLEGGKVDHDELLNAGIGGMLRWMDRHSSYLPPQDYAKFFTDLEAEYGGIGAYVNEDADGYFTIVRPIYSGPAYKAGLMTDDKIVRIGTWPTIGQPEEDIIKRLKGKPGTPVELYIWRRGMDPELIDRPTEDMKVTVNRGRIEIPAGSYQMLPGDIGLVELTTFSQKSTKQLKEWIPALREDGMRALILDMRRNSGGLLTEARAVADLFLPRGKVVVSTEGRERGSEALRTITDPILPEDFPVVILTGRMTASAAEIVAGALQDHGRAQLVGRQTFGKGSVQQLLPILTDREDLWMDENRNGRWDAGERIVRDWDDDGEIDYAPRVKLTIARYLLPSGRSIHRELDREGNLISEGGVMPDHDVDMPLIERWRFDEQRRIRRSDPMLDYVADNYDQNRELFGRLAVNDQKDPGLYPGFDSLVVSLDTTLSRDDVRKVLRGEIRRRVQDDMGREFPWGDYVEDPQVQKGIEVALSQLGESVENITEYGLVFDFERPENDQSIALVRPDSASLQHARRLLQEARDGRSDLTTESLDELIGLIQELEDLEEN